MTVDACGGAIPGSRARAFALGDRLIESLLSAVAARERVRQRRLLRVRAEDPDFLRDVGLSREEALEESAEPFWRGR